MSNGDLHWIANFIWNIADDVLRDLYVLGKYRDVILPMIVLRRLDAVLEDGKQAVLSMRRSSTTPGWLNRTARCAPPRGTPSTTRRRSPCGD